MDNWQNGIEFGKQRNDVSHDKKSQQKRADFSKKIYNLLKKRKKNPEAKIDIGWGVLVSIDNAIQYYENLLGN